MGEARPGADQGASMKGRPPPNRVNRTHLLWLGDAVPASLYRHVAALVPRAITAGQLDDAAPTARMLIIPVPVDVTDAQQTYGRLICRARDHGLRVVLVPDRSLPPEEVMPYFNATKSVAEGDGGRILIGFDDHLFDEAQLAPPGIGANRDLRFTGDPPDEVSVILFQRAFADAESVHLEAIKSGKSGAMVWRVQRIRAGGKPFPMPLLVKVARLEKIASERASAGFVADLIHSRSRAILHPQRCVEGATHGLLAFDFFNNTQDFDVAVRSNPDVVLASLIGVTLRHCIEEARDSEGRLSQVLEDIKAYRLSPALTEAADLARSRSAACVPLEIFHARWKGLPTLAYRAGPVHGDLHTGNLLLPPNSSDVLVIDYGSFLSFAPACADLACLEVSLVFPQNQCSRAPAEHEAIRRLYAVEVPPPSYGESEPAKLQKVIRALRQSAHTIEPNSAVLALAQAAYLIRYASYEDSGALEERALAYELACTLLARVEATLAVARD